MLRGTITGSSSYALNGDTCNFAALGVNALLAAGSPTVIVGNDDGYVCEHNRGTASAGTIIIRVATQNSTNVAVMAQVSPGTAVNAVVMPFVAYGPAY
jgi:hypothetical protein